MLFGGVFQLFLPEFLPVKQMAVEFLINSIIILVIPIRIREWEAFGLSWVYFISNDEMNQIVTTCIKIALQNQRLQRKIMIKMK